MKYLWHDGPCHGSTSIRRNGVNKNVVLDTFPCQCPREAKDGQFGSSIVGLSEVPVDTARRCGINDTPILLLQKDGPSSFGYFVGSVEMNRHNLVPLFIGHCSERFVTQDTSIVDDDVNCAEGLHTGFDDSFAILNGMLIAHSLSTSLADLCNSGVGVHNVIYNHRSAEFGEEEGISTTEAVTGC